MQQPSWTATVVEHHRLRKDLAVVRLVGEPVPFRPGQYVDVTVPQFPRLPRRLSPALPPSRDGKLEFHVRAIPGGWVSGSIVADTRPGDQWQISSPRGELTVDENGPTVVMVAGGTGLAPLRSIILDLTRVEKPPRVYLFVGGRTVQDLYASDMLWMLTEQLPWLTTIPVVEDVTGRGVPDEWYQRIRAAIGPETLFGFTEDHLLEGTLGDVVAAHGAFVNHQVLVCGSPGMVQSTRERLTATGTPARAIQFDPLG
ncbi:FAD-binding oxidoreductase [Rhodococcus spongiicola]|uniref:Oxidoreductase n=1 Tax=Rhodococcus spongiicola TaxID=2487352 RepID=A0A3S3A4A1_9NOCA|nr:FAD-binding oxidoreductase [Rhodococcus spongiicola]RVW01717.1 oxidoreductase [Rhodococcus spongiicola]